MNEPRQQLILKVDDRVAAYLGKLAAEQGGNATLYAQQLFEAAYAVRCGVAQDEPLAAAIAAKTTVRPAIAAPPSVAQADPAQAKRDAQRVATAERHAATMVEERRAIAETLEQERRENADNLKAASEALELKQAETAQLDRELAELRAKNELLDLMAEAFEERADRALHELRTVEEAARGHRSDAEDWTARAQREMARADEAMAIVRERTSLWTEITSLQRLGAALAAAATDLAPMRHGPTNVITVAELPHEVLEAVYGPLAAAVVATPEPEPAPVAPIAPQPRKAAAAKADDFIWKKHWGRG